MKRPSFQFYPEAWTTNAKLRRCTKAARGAWMDILCAMHDSDEYGVLRWPLKEIAQATGSTMGQVRELVEKGVLKGADRGGSIEPFIYTPRHAGRDGTPVELLPAQDGPIWYSSRLVRDEYIRSKRGEGTRFGDGGDAPKGAPKHTPKPPIGERKDDARSRPPTRREGHGPLSLSRSLGTKPSQRINGVDKHEDLSTATAENGAAAAASSLIFPGKLSSSQRETVIPILQEGTTRPQLLLDELQGMIEVGKANDPVAVLLELLKQEREKRFVPSHAHRVEAERELAQTQREVALAGRT